LTRTAPSTWPIIVAVNAVLLKGVEDDLEGPV
jgi:hypothetical protein